MNQQITPEKIEEITQKINSELEFVLDSLGVDLEKVNFNNNEIRMACPVHCGNNVSSFVYNKNYGTWRCWSKQCHEGHQTIIQLCQLLLSKKLGKTINFLSAITYLCDILKISPSNSFEIIDQEKLEISKLINDNKSKGEDKQQNKDYFKPFSIKLLQKSFKPSEYFLNKGFKYETLKKFCISYCDDPQKPLYKRSCVPILSDDGLTVVGVSGRTIYEKCDLCGLYHKDGNGCPQDNSNVKSVVKWMHYGFCSSRVIYNCWNIKNYKSIIITEGPKDVWMLDQYNILNSTCLFGLNVSKYHIEKLIKIGIIKIILALNNDPRGLEASEKNTKVLEQYFTIKNLSPYLPAKDISMLSQKDILNLFHE